MPISLIPHPGKTALSHAAYFGHKECVSELLSGDPVTNKDEAGFTPLHYAAWGGWLDLLEDLAEKTEKSLMVEDKDRLTPMDRAVINGKHLVEQWLSKKSGVVLVDAAHLLRLVVSTGRRANPLLCLLLLLLFYYYLYC